MRVRSRESVVPTDPAAGRIRLGLELYRGTSTFSRLVGDKDALLGEYSPRPLEQHPMKDSLTSDTGQWCYQAPVVERRDDAHRT